MLLAIKNNSLQDNERKVCMLEIQEGRRTRFYKEFWILFKNHRLSYAKVDDVSNRNLIIISSAWQVARSRKFMDSYLLKT